MAAQPTLDGAHPREGAHARDATGGDTDADDGVGAAVRARDRAGDGAGVHADARARDGAHIGDGRLSELGTALDAVLAARLDELTDEEIVGELEVLEIARRRIETRVCRATATLTRRRAARASQQAPDDPRAAERAGQALRRELSGRLNWAPGRAKRAANDGKHIGSVPQAGAAADDGRLSTRHARILADTLNHFRPGPQRDTLEAELVEAAADMDPTAFGRHCRQRLAEVDHDAAMRDQARRNARQRATLSHDDRGMTRLAGEFAGMDAEIVATAVHAFRRPDTPGEHRSPERRTADAVVDAFKAALDAGTAPANRGVRPHVIVTVPVKVAADGAGAVAARWTGPVPLGEIRRALDDAGLSWLAVDEDSGLPMMASAESRHVPVGLWRALELRDRGCIAVGCDAPPAWCDVMHLGEPFHDGGRLSLDDAGLGCRSHHRKLDLAGWTITWIDGRPVLHHPDQPPDPERRARDGPDP